MANTDRGTKISGYVPPMCLARLKDIASSRDSTVEALVEWVMQDFAAEKYRDTWLMPELRLDARRCKAKTERKPVVKRKFRNTLEDRVGVKSGKRGGIRGSTTRIGRSLKVE